MKNAVLTRMRKNVCRNFPAAGVSLLLATAFCLVFAWYSTPLLPKVMGYDASFFRLVGEGMTKGYLPYRDFFDQKGPYLFFIQWLAQVIWSGRVGIFILEILSVASSCFLCYKTASLFLKKTWLRYGSAIILLGLLMLFFGGGNLVSEWCLPLSMLCVYLFAKHYIQNPDIPHPAKYAFWYGLCFMTIVLTRMIDAAVICAVVFAALVMLLKDKQYKVLFQNMGTFLLGCAVSITPVLIWGIANNLLYDIFYDSFVFAFLYAADKTASFRWALLLLLFPVFVTAFFWKKLDVVFRVFFLSGVIFAGIVLNVGGGYFHYILICFPLIMPAIEIILSSVESEGIRNKKVACLIACAVLTVLPLVETAVRAIYDTYKVQVQHVYDGDYDASTDIISYIPESEMQNVLSFDTNFMPYLTGNFFPCNRYCGWQRHYIELETEIAVEMVSAMRETPVLWMITPAGYNISNESISSCLQTEYELYAQNEKFELYHRKMT